MINRISIDNFLGGLAPSRYYGASVAGTTMADPASAGWFPVHTTAPDSGLNEVNILQRGYQLSSITNVSAITGDIKWIKSFSRGSTNYAYLLSVNDGASANANVLHRLDLSTSTITNGGGSFPHSMATNSDALGMEFFTTSSTNYLYYAHGANLGRYDLNTTFDDTYKTTLGTTCLGETIPHPMVQGYGKLFIGNSNMSLSTACIATLDNAGTLTEIALNLGATQQIVRALEFFGDYLYIAMASTTSASGNVYRSSASLKIWDTVSSSWQREYIFPEEEIASIKASNGSIYCWGRRGFYRFNGSGFDMVYPMSSGPAYPSAVDVSPDGFVYFKGAAIAGTTSILAYGSPDPRIPQAMHIPYETNGGNALPIFWASKTNFYVAYGSGDRLRLYSSSGAAGYGGATWRTPMFKFPKPARLASVTVVFNTLGTARFRIGWAPRDGLVETQVASVSSDSQSGQKFFIDGLIDDSWQIMITHTAGVTPKIQKIDIDYELEQD